MAVAYDDLLTGCSIFKNTYHTLGDFAAMLRQTAGSRGRSPQGMTDIFKSEHPDKRSPYATGGWLVIAHIVLMPDFGAMKNFRQRIPAFDPFFIEKR